MNRKLHSVLLLVMAMVMMAMSPLKVWADDVEITALSGSPNSENEGYEKLFDGNNTTKWCGGVSEDDPDFGYYVIFKLSGCHRLSSYTLVDGADTGRYYGRHWKSWTLCGANFTSAADAQQYSESWTQIDERDGSIANGADQVFAVNAETPYQYYMIRVLEVGCSYYYDDGQNNYREEGMQQMADVLFAWDAEEPTEDNEGDAEPVTNLKEGQNFYLDLSKSFTFTPTQAGDYKVMVAPSSLIRIMRGDKVIASGFGTASATGLAADQQYTILLNGFSEATQGTIVINRAGDATSDVEGGETVKCLTVGENTVKICKYEQYPKSTKFYYSFTPETDGNYLISFSKDGNELKVYATITENGFIPGTIVLKQCSALTANDLTAGTALMLYADGYMDDYEDATITITKALSVGKNTVDIYAYDDEGTDPKYYYTFTPEVPGVYTFTFSHNGSEIQVDAGFDEDANGAGAVDCTSLTTDPLTAGTTYMLYVDGDGGDYKDAIITITMVPTLTVGPNAVHIYPYDDENDSDSKYFYIFTPTEAGSYTFAFTDFGRPITVCADLGQGVRENDVLEISDFAVALAAQTNYMLYVDGDESEYAFATLTISKVEGTAPLPTHEREMAYEWGTICLPFPVTYDAANGNYKLYTLTAASATALTFTEIANETTIPAGTPMAIKAVGKKNAETGKYDISIAGSGAIDFSASVNRIKLENGYEMSGVFCRYYNVKDVYFIAQNQFWWAESAITVPAYRAWIYAPSEPEANAPLRIVTEDETEGIEFIDSDNGTLQMVNGQCLDLQGRQTNSRKGLQIRDGRVVMIK